MKRVELDEMKAVLRDSKTVNELGGIATGIVQSDKLGFDWLETRVNGVAVKREYVEQSNPVGTSADNPIEYTEGVPLINNAYYLLDGTIKFWMEGWVG